MTEICQPTHFTSVREAGQGVPVVLDRLGQQYGPVSWVPSGKPVDELVSTILSQNTSDTNTARAFASLRRRFSDWHEVVTSPTGEVVSAIRSGGLAEQKAPRIQHALEQVLGTPEEDANKAFCHQLKSLGLEDARSFLTSLPGIGPKTAACVLLFAVGLPALPVDTHVHRVSKRLGLIDSRIDAGRAHDALQDIVQPDSVYAFHVYLIRHGREVCRSRNPRCSVCVLNDMCTYARHHDDKLERNRPADTVSVLSEQPE